jgi:hypothetical protein
MGMTIFVDFDLFGVEEIDTVLLDVLIAFKKKVVALLQPFEERINREGVIPFIRVGPDLIGIGFLGASESFLAELTKEVTVKCDMREVLEELTVRAMN